MSHGVPGYVPIASVVIHRGNGFSGKTPGPRGLNQRVSARMVKSTDKSIYRGRRPQRLKGSVSASKGLDLVNAHPLRCLPYRH